jgi:transposase InsO family protein
MAPSTVQSILRSAGLARLDRGDRATSTEPVRRYQRDRPGELIHVDIKKLAAIPDGGGWKMHGRGYSPGGDHQRAGYRYIHTAIDDRTRIAYSEIHSNEQSVTAAEFMARAVAWFTNRGVTVERVLTDNGSCYRSALWHQTCAELGVKVKKTRPRRPQTNGKVERFHRILLEEWAYIRDWTSENQRAHGYRRFIHFYNHHRSHGALNWATPMTTLNHLIEDNLPEEHS